MCSIAVGVGIAVFADSEDRHGEGMAFLDVMLGVVALIALVVAPALRPPAVGVFTAALSIVSAFAAGPALIAGFNVALRGSRRGDPRGRRRTSVSIFVFPLLYPSGRPVPA